MGMGLAVGEGRGRAEGELVIYLATARLALLVEPATEKLLIYSA